MVKESNLPVFFCLGYLHLKLCHALLPFFLIMLLLVLLQIPECMDTILINQFQAAAPVSDVIVIVICYHWNWEACPGFTKKLSIYLFMENANEQDQNDRKPRNKLHISHAVCSPMRL